MDRKWIEKIQEAGGFYEFDYSNPEDAAYVLDSLGGEENLKQNYPLVYEAFLASVRKDGLKRRRDGAEDSKVGMKLNTLAAETCGNGKKVRASAAGIFADPDYAAENALKKEAPRPWLSGNLTARIYNYRDPVEVYSNSSFFFEKTDNFQYEFETDILPAEAAAKCGAMILLHAVDPNNCLKTYADSRPALGGSIDIVDTFSVSDPLSPHGNNPIIMLYGRKREQNSGYTNADYYNDSPGEYFNNKPQNGRLKTIMPMKGEIKLAAGCSFPAGGVLHRPQASEPPPFNTLIRSNLKVGGIKVATMYEDLTDDKAYEELAKCFTVDTGGAHPTIRFDITRDGGHNWYSDTQGVGDWTNNVMTYMLNGGFILDVFDPNHNPMQVQFSITSSPIENMRGKQYYVSNTCQVYVPPVTVHWGCLAGDTSVCLASGQDKRMDRLHKGDQVLTSDGRTVTFLEAVTGEEEKIFQIRAAAGTIKLTGGHPVLLWDGTPKAAGLLAAGDRLMTPDGESVVLEVGEEEYGGTVYSPVFLESDAEGLFILCNGLYCGDYNAQNRTEHSTWKLTDRQEALTSQFRELTSLLV